MTQLRFITVSDPADARSQAHRKAVRSHAAHRRPLPLKQRKATSQGSERNRRRPKKSDATTTLKVVDTKTPLVEFHVVSTEVVQGDQSHITPQPMLAPEDNYAYWSPFGGHKPLLSPVPLPASAYNLPLVTFDKGFGGFGVDPFRTYPSSFEPFMPRVINHCKLSCLYLWGFLLMSNLVIPFMLHVQQQKWL